MSFLVRAPRRARWSTLVLLLGCYAQPEPARAAEETAADCVGFQNDVGEKLLVVHASNACERRLRCSLTYTVKCEDHQGKLTSRADKHAAFRLEPKGAYDLSLSAAACKQGWGIDELAWTCS